MMTSIYSFAFLELTRNIQDEENDFFRELLRMVTRFIDAGPPKRLALTGTSGVKGRPRSVMAIVDGNGTRVQGTSELNILAIGSIGFTS